MPSRARHCVRNPFDNIARMALVIGAELESAVEPCFRSFDWAKDASKRLDPGEIMHLYPQRMIA